MVEVGSQKKDNNNFWFHIFEIPKFRKINLNSNFVEKNSKKFKIKITNFEIHMA
jgi:hypothetical protein